MQSQFTNNAQEALKAAARCASALKQGYVGTEHILAGLLKEKNGVAHKVLTDNGVELSRVTDMIRESIAFDGGVEIREREGYSPRAHKILEEAQRFVDWFGSAQIQGEWAQEFSTLPANEKAVGMANEFNQEIAKIPAQDIDWSLVAQNIDAWCEKIILEYMP